MDSMLTIPFADHEARIMGKNGSFDYSYNPQGSVYGDFQIIVGQHEGLRQAMRIKMEQGEAKEIYKRRKVIVEPVFGQIKNGGFRGFSLRGKEKVAGEFSLVCMAHNIKNGESDYDRISVSSVWANGYAG